jgi:hypothetical protein
VFKDGAPAPLRARQFGLKVGDALPALLKILVFHQFLRGLTGRRSRKEGTSLIA